MLTMGSHNKLFWFYYVCHIFPNLVSPSQIFLASNSNVEVFLSNASFRSDLEINGSDLIINYTESYYFFVCEGNSPLEWKSTAHAKGVLKLNQYLIPPTNKFIAELFIGLWGKSGGTISCGFLGSKKNESVIVNLYVNGAEESGFVGKDELIFITDWSFLPDGCQIIEIPCAVSHPRIVPTLFGVRNQTWEKTDYINYEPSTGFRKNVCLADNESAFQCRLPKESVTINLKTIKFHVEPNKSELFTFPGQQVTLKCFGSNMSFIRHTDSGNSSLKVLMHTTDWFDSSHTLVVHNLKIEFKENVTVTCEDHDNHHTWNLVFYQNKRNLTHKFWRFRGDESSFQCQVPNHDVKVKNIKCSTVNECSLRRRYDNYFDYEFSEFDHPQNESGSKNPAILVYLPSGSLECIADTANLFLQYFTGLNGVTYFVGIDNIPDDAIVATKSSMNVIKSLGKVSEFLICKYSLFLLMHYTKWWIKYENGTVARIGRSNIANRTEEDEEFANRYVLLNTFTETVRIIVTPEMDEAICGAPQRSNGDWKYATYKFTVNRRGKPLSASKLPGIVLGLAAAIGVAAVSIATVIKIFRLRQKKTLNDSDIQFFFNGGNGESCEKSKHTIKEDAAGYAVGIPYNDFYELESDYLKYSSQNLIGTGAFGLVFGGSYLGKPVAIKTVKCNVDIESFKTALAELKMLMYVGFHTNIVKFVGAVTKNIQNLQLEIVLELCSKGCLNTYLRKHVKQSNQKRLTNLIIQQLKWCVDITHALGYLFQRKIIHGDLATRNVLLDDCLTAKLSDFGLSTKSVSYSAYVKKSKEALLPWRWMAVESLTKCNFSAASDMWSFGVVVWEIFTLGEIPYPAQHWDESFIEFLNQGRRLPKPHSCPDEIYEVLLQCWDYEEKFRPSILHVREILDVLMLIKSLEEKLVLATSK